MDGTAFPKTTTNNWNLELELELVQQQQQELMLTGTWGRSKRNKEVYKTPSSSLSTIHSSQTGNSCRNRFQIYFTRAQSDCRAAVFTNPGEEHSRQYSKSHQITSRECFSFVCFLTLSILIFLVAPSYS